MFTPEKLPCDAWLVTEDLRIKPVRLTRSGIYTNLFISSADDLYSDGELYETANKAVAAAMAQLDAKKGVHALHGRRLAQLEKNVNSMFLSVQEGGAA